MQVPSPSDDYAGFECKHCGAAIEPTSKFCPNCGATQTSQPVNTAAPSVPSEEPSLKPKATVLTSDDERLHQPYKSRSIASHRLFWLGLAAVLIALASVGSWAWVAKHPITAKAQYALAEKYEKGDGVPQDYSQAAFWYRKAAEQGDDDAQKRLDELPIPQPLTQETISKVTGITNDISNADWRQILDLPQVSKNAERLFGPQLLYFRKAGHGSAEITDGLLIAQGCIPHFCPNGGVLTIDVKTGATAGGLADETGITVYTGDYTRDKLPSPLKQWLENYNYLSVRYQDAQIAASHLSNGGGSASGKQSDEASARISSLITSDKEFTVCRVKDLEYLRLGDGQPYDTGFQSAKTLEFLNDVGYIHISKYAQPDGYYHTTEYYWLPTQKGLAALGSDIREEKSGNNRLGMAVYKWTLILGCRELSGIDATTPLADGEKVDFSWHWKITDLGIAAKLTDERQRGAAYFVRKGDGLAIDKVQIGANDNQ
jgi:hypothetical protein